MRKKEELSSLLQAEEEEEEDLDAVSNYHRHNGVPSTSPLLSTLAVPTPIRNRNISETTVPHDIDLEEFPMGGNHQYITQFHPGSGDLASSSDIVDSSATHYNNYDTIDWTRDAMLDRRQRSAFDSLSKGTCLPLFKGYYRLQAWLLIILIAVSSGVLAGIIDVGVELLSDLRFGFCTNGFHISRSLCCPADMSCTAWRSWSSALRLGTGGWLLDYFLYVLLAIFFTGLAAWFVKRFARFAAGSGIPEVKTILGGFVIKSFATPITLLVKCVGLILSVSAGLNAGKEGPMVHVAVCCGEIFSRIFPKYYKNEGKKREILSAAAAAGVSVAFGAPIGGVLFSLEEVSYYFPHKVLWRTFFCANIAALALSLMNPLHTGKLVIFEVKYDHMWHYYELVPFIIIATLGGLMAVLFIKLNTKMCFFRKHSILKQYPITEAMAVAGITAIVSYLNPYLSGNTGETVGALFGECVPDPVRSTPLCNPELAGSTIGTLLTATAIRLFLVIFTFGLRVPAGIFIPCIAIGASFGRAAGIVMEVIRRAHADLWVFAVCKSSTECLTPGVYAMVGATAVLSGVTRMTVSLVVIVFELTGQLDYILPLMLAVMVSKWVADAFGNDGIYDKHIQLNGYPFLDNKKDYRFTTQAIDVLRTRELSVLPEAGHTIGDLKGILSSRHYTGFPIVNNMEEKLLRGYITRAELRVALDRALNTLNLPPTTPCYFTDIPPASRNVGGNGALDLTPWMDSAPLTVVEHTPLNIVYDLFKKLGLRVCLVVQQGRLVGIISKKDILRHLPKSKVGLSH